MRGIVARAFGLLLVVLGSACVAPPAEPPTEPPAGPAALDRAFPDLGEPHPFPRARSVELGTLVPPAVETVRTTTALPPPDNACPEGAPPSPESWFVDVTECASGGTHPHVVAWEEWWASGQAWADVDGDGRLDLVLTSQDGANGLLMQQPDGRLRPWQDAGIAGPPGGGATLADVDGDGDPDLFLSVWGPDQLFLNEGGVFEPVDSGPNHDGLGVGSAWADIDADGELELYAASYACPVCDWQDDDPANFAADRLWDRAEDGSWVDRSDLLGADLLSGLAFQASFADLDDDGDLDLYVANDKGDLGMPSAGEMNRNPLFRNDGPGCDGPCFEEVGVEAGADLRINSMCIAVGDYDNDLDLDLVVTDSTQTHLLQNLGGGEFVDSSVASGLADEPLDGWGCVFFDYDNDGWLDLFTGGGPEFDDRLLHNQGDGTFEDQTEGAGLTRQAHTLGVAAADYDRDGAVDLVLARRDEGYEVHRNMAAANGWVGLRLVGSGVGGTDAVGARVYVEDSSGRTQMREVKIGSSLGAGNDLGLHFGLGEAELVATTVVWPDGTQEVVDAPPNVWSVLTREP